MSILISTIYTLIFVITMILDNVERPYSPPTKEQLLLEKTYSIKRGLYYDDIELLNAMVDLSSINVLETTWITGKTEVKRKQYDSFFDIDLDANQWWLIAAIKTDSDLGILTQKCPSSYTGQLINQDSVDINKLTSSTLFTGNSSYKIHQACDFHGPALVLGSFSIDQESNTLLIYMHTFS